MIVVGEFEALTLEKSNFQGSCMKQKFFLQQAIQWSCFLNPSYVFPLKEGIQPVPNQGGRQSYAGSCCFSLTRLMEPPLSTFATGFLSQRQSCRA